MSADADPLTDNPLTRDDLDLLRRPLYGFFSPAAAPAPPQPRPIWYEVTADRAIESFTLPDSVRVRRLRQDPRASLVVAAPVGERERWVSVSGSTTVHTDGAAELVTRLARRYWDLDDPVRVRDLDDLLAETWVRVVLRPEKVARYRM